MWSAKEHLGLWSCWLEILVWGNGFWLAILVLGNGFWLEILVWGNGAPWVGWLVGFWLEILVWWGNGSPGTHVRSSGRLSIARWIGLDCYPRKIGLLSQADWRKHGWTVITPLTSPPHWTDHTVVALTLTPQHRAAWHNTRHPESMTENNRLISLKVGLIHICELWRQIVFLSGQQKCFRSYLSFQDLFWQWLACRVWYCGHPSSSFKWWVGSKILEWLCVLLLDISAEWWWSTWRWHCCVVMTRHNVVMTWHNVVMTQQRGKNVVAVPLWSSRPSSKYASTK